MYGVLHLYSCNLYTLYDLYVKGKINSLAPALSLSQHIKQVNWFLYFTYPESQQLMELGG